MDHRRTENFYIIVPPGLEETCAAELNAIGMAPLHIDKGGIGCVGRLRELYLANLWLRTASRILVRFAEWRSRDFPDLYRKTSRLPWGRFIHPERSVAFRVACHGSRLKHSTRVAETLEHQLETALAALLSLVEPLLILLMGGMIGFVVLAVLLPIFQASQGLG